MMTLAMYLDLVLLNGSPNEPSGIGVAPFHPVCSPGITEIRTLTSNNALHFEGWTVILQRWGDCVLIVEWGDDPQREPGMLP